MAAARRTPPISRELRDGIVALLPPDCRLPWHADFCGFGDIRDAGGVLVATISPHVYTAAAARHNIAHAICLAVNAAAGRDTESTHA